MSIPTPEPGLVISYSYLWHYEHDVGKEEGRKDRPCVIILAAESVKEGMKVTVAPITHRLPDPANDAMEIPLKVKQHLGLDDMRSWVITNEVNQFIWPGYDLRSVPGKPGRFEYGFLPPKLFDAIKRHVVDCFAEARLVSVARD